MGFSFLEDIAQTVKYKQASDNTAFDRRGRSEKTGPPLPSLKQISLSCVGLGSEPTYRLTKF
jgi:hypothetical protein